MKPKSFLLSALGFAAVLAMALGPRPSHGQAGADEVVLAQLVAEVAKQQATVVANQNQIDTKLATISEDLRIARIYVGRGGGKAGGN